MKHRYAHILLPFILGLILVTTAAPSRAVRLEDKDVIQTPAAQSQGASAPAPALPLSGDTRQPGEPRQITLAILDFGDGMHAPGIGRAVSDMLIGALADDPMIRIFERAQLDQILEEQKRANPSDMDGNTIRAAREVGVQFVLTGKVSEFGINENGILIPGKGTVTQYKARATLDVRLISVADAGVIKTWTTTGSETSYNLGVNILGIPNFSFSGRQFEESLLGRATRQAVDSAASFIREDVRTPLIQENIASMPLSGKVADVEGDDLILNIGSLAGMEMGWSVNIYRLEKQVKDPDTGELLMEKRSFLATAFVYSVEEKYSKAQILQTGTGAAVMVGDQVEIAKSNGNATPFETNSDD